MTVFVAIQCGVGKEQCEDTVLVDDTLICDGNAEISIREEGAVCVADGVGGNAGGHFASTFVAGRIKSITAELDKANLQQSLKSVNSALIAEGNANGFPTAATTLTGIIYAGGQECLVHIGNTRAYVLQGKYLKQLTSDHTVYNRLLKMGRFGDAAKSKRNEITNCFGGGKPSLFESINISEIQEFGTLLLTSDGVHDYIGIDDLEHLLAAEVLSVQTCNSIIQAALAAGSKDDISAVIVQK
ncbi:Serine/threonine phosphatase stp [bioreactor metagenome]|uniref:Serine/threonine phosphatase stp n=1 Tax=bioreactor metagenome TaxID=1076179 RepID=A0A644XB77_9ZZZZ